MKPNKADERKRDERVQDAYEGFLRGKLTQREFLRYASVMGASLAGASLVACGAPAVSTTPTTAAVPPTAVAAAPTATVPPAMPTTVPTEVVSNKRGGKLVASLSYSTERFNDP